MKLATLTAVAALAFLAASPAAHATAASTSAASQSYSFSFTGSCTDCTGSGTATLQVKDYVLGTELNSSNLVSFTYSSNTTSFSDVPGYDSQTGTSEVFVDSLYGMLDASPGPYQVHVEQTSAGVTTNMFNSTQDATWTVSSNSPVSDGGVGAIGPAEPQDYGTNGVWNESVSAVSAAPEPETWALFLGGVGLLGGMMRIARARRREDERKNIATA